MAQDNWQQVRDIFADAVRQKPEVRRQFLMQACDGDPELCREVESLLSSYDSADSFMESPAVVLVAEAIVEEIPQLQIGQTLGHYEIIGQIGKGGMGEVYLAHDKTLDRKVAVKVLYESISRDESNLLRFIHEAKAASGLNHPNILVIHEIGETENAHYIVSEYVEGSTLREFLKNKPLKLSQVLDFSIQIAGALTAAHEAHLIHRDIKPENIMVRPDGFVKVLDFGLAKLIEQKNRSFIDLEAKTKQQNLTAKGVILGTVSYMSPEQAQGKETDERTDIWSLGIVLYEMLSGRPPFEGKTTNHTIVSILENEPKQVDSIPNALQRIIRKTLTKERENRYQATRDLLIDLKNLKHELEVQGELERSVKPNKDAEPAKENEVSRSGTGDNIATVQDAVGHQTADEQVQQTQTHISGTQAVTSSIKRHKFGAAAAFVVAAIVLSGFGYGLYQFIKSPEETQPQRSSNSLIARRLTGDGKTFGAVISPDGKFLAFLKSGDLWLKQIETNSEVELVPKGEFSGGVNFLAFSPDGNFIYFNGAKTGDKTRNVYRVPTLGARPVKVLSDAFGVSISPDGKQIAFMRRSGNAAETISIYTANIDGTDERKLTSRSGKRYFASGAIWSPDGKFLAVMTGDDTLSPKPSIPVTISVTDGTITNLGKQYFAGLGHIVWHPKGDVIYVLAFETTLRKQLWEIGYPSGESRRLTQSTSNYNGLSMAADGNSMATVQSEVKAGIWVSPDTDPKNAKQVTPDNSDISGMSWTPDGKIVYISDQSGDNEVWIMDKTGENSKQLTNDRKFKQYPDVSTDGRFIVYSRANGQIFRINIDGGSPLQLTTGVGGYFAKFSPDGKWVIFRHFSDIGIFRVPIDGGTPQKLTDYPSRFPRYSPDGKFFACEISDMKTHKRNRIAIVPAEGGAPVKVLELPATAGSFLGYGWTPDGKNVTYFDRGDEGLWIQPIDGGPPKKLEVPKYRSTHIMDRDYSRDGKQIAIMMGETFSNAVLITDFR